MNCPLFLLFRQGGLDTHNNIPALLRVSFVISGRKRDRERETETETETEIQREIQREGDRERERTHDVCGAQRLASVLQELYTLIFDPSHWSGDLLTYLAWLPSEHQ